MMAKHSMHISTWMRTLRLAGATPTLQCPCGETNNERVLDYDNPPVGEVSFPIIGSYKRAYMRCVICRHFFSQHEMDMSSLYGRDYLNATYGGREGVRAAFERVSALQPSASDNHHRVLRVNDFADTWFESNESDRSLLDIGSGIGVFVSGMKSMGWKCTALDPDGRFSEHARDTVGVETMTCDFADVDISSWGNFDCVSLNKVLEHVEDPVAFLRKAGRLLSARGISYIEVPDGEMAVHDGSGREEFFIDHHHVFSPVSLASILIRAGLELLQLERLREPSGKFTLFAFANAAI